MSKKLQLHFSKAFEGDIWQQSLSEDLLLITTRDHERMQVGFTLLNINDGAARFEELSFEEDWWISAYHFYAQVAVFQVYEDTQDIESKSYIALDIESQEALWSLDKVQAVGRQGHYLQLRSEEAGDAFFWIDIRSGETYGEIPQNIEEAAISESVIYPFHYTEESSHFHTVSEFVSKQLEVMPVGACDYLEYNGLLFVSFHTKAPEGMTNVLAVFDEGGILVMKKSLHTGLKGMVAEAFFIAGEQLIFVEGRNTIKSYLIKN